jgi:hypothetical protein
MNILILGAGCAQLDAINFCNEQGKITYCISNSERDPGAKLAHHYTKIDITDYDAVIEYILLNEIETIIAHGSDIALKTAAIIHEKLNIPYYVNPHQVDTLIVKSNFRDFLSHHHLPCVNYIIAKSIDDLEHWH